MQKTACSDGTKAAVPGPVRVAHLSSGHHADDERIFWKECLSLARAGYDVSLIVPEEYPSRLAGLPADIRVNTIPSRPGRFRRLVLMPWLLLAASLQRKA